MSRRIHRSRIDGDDDDEGASPPSSPPRPSLSSNTAGSPSSFIRITDSHAAAAAGPGQEDEGLPPLPFQTRAHLSRVNTVRRSHMSSPANDDEKARARRESQQRSTFIQATLGRVTPSNFESSDTDGTRDSKMSTMGSDAGGPGVARRHGNAVGRDQGKFVAMEGFQTPDRKPGATAVYPSSPMQVSHRVQSTSSSNTSDNRPLVMDSAAQAAFPTPIAAEVANDNNNVDVEAQVNKRVSQQTDHIAAEVQRRILNQAVVADVMQDDDKEKFSCKKKWGIAIGILVLMAIVGVVVGVVLAGKKEGNGNSNEPTQAPSTTLPTPAPSPSGTMPAPTLSTETPTTSPTELPTLRETGSLQSVLEVEFGPIQAGTPQAEALNWMENEDPAQLEANNTFKILKERYVIAVLYFATNGASWKDTFGFLDGTSYCNWNDGTSTPTQFSGKGVFCDDRHSVTHIRLPFNNLQGRLEKELTALWFLEVLDLSRNGLRGTIPSSMGLLRSLEFLHVGDNLFTGTFPNSIFDLPELDTVYLFLNSELGGAIPDTLGVSSGRQLKNIGMSKCRITGSLPSSMALLSNLVFLNLAKNSLTGSVPAFSSQTITTISLSDNSLYGVIPTEIGGLQQLEHINVGGNSLSGPLPIFSSSRRLSNVAFRENAFTGNVEEFLTPLLETSGLEGVSLFSNDLSGSIPEFIGDFGRLTYLNIELNTLEGTLPTQIGLLRRLKYMDFFSSNLDGSIPSEVGQLTSLEFFDLANNNWAGTTIPSEVGRLRNVKHLNLATNGLVGTLPTEIASIPALEQLWVHGNTLDGSLDPFFCERSTPLQDFRSDCSGETQCSCCTFCCDPSGSNCMSV